MAMIWRRRPTPATDPFAVLGLDKSPDVSDEDVRIAWRRAASETHPDREDGGHPARFAAAAAAYTALRTRFARGEVLADLGVIPPRAQKRERRRGGGTDARAAESTTGRRSLPVWGFASLTRAAGRLAGQARHGRPLRLGLRILAAAVASTAAVLAAGPHPAAPALVTGAATWLILTARRDLAPPGR
jgi:curved DNA-binding protein CbpA